MTQQAGVSCNAKCTVLMEAQEKIPYCPNINRVVGSEPSWLFNKAGLLCSKASVNDCVQVVVSKNL